MLEVRMWLGRAGLLRMNPRRIGFNGFLDDQSGADTALRTCTEYAKSAHFMQGPRRRRSRMRGARCLEPRFPPQTGFTRTLHFCVELSARRLVSTLKPHLPSAIALSLVTRTTHQGKEQYNESTRYHTQRARTCRRALIRTAARRRGSRSRSRRTGSGRRPEGAP
jgi:hypothetical protein